MKRKTSYPIYIVLLMSVIVGVFVGVYSGWGWGMGAGPITLIGLVIVIWIWMNVWEVLQRALNLPIGSCLACSHPIRAKAPDKCENCGEKYFKPIP